MKLCASHLLFRGRQAHNPFHHIYIRPLSLKYKRMVPELHRGGPLDRIFTQAYCHKIDHIRREVCIWIQFGWRLMHNMLQ